MARLSNMAGHLSLGSVINVYLSVLDPSVRQSVLKN